MMKKSICSTYPGLSSSIKISKIFFAKWVFALVLLIGSNNVIFAQATLPVATTNLSKGSLPTGFTHSGLGSDYSGPKLKFDDADDFLVLFFSGTPGTLTFDVGVNNTFPGNIPSGSTFTVQESDAGSSWTTLGTYSNVAGGTKTLSPASSTRYIRWYYTTKASGSNITLFKINLTAGVVSCTSPTTQASIFTSSNITKTTATAGWTRGNGNNVLVVARAGSAVNADPVSGTSYTANAAFGLGTQIGTGNYVVFNGSGTSVDLTALTAGTKYYFAVYEYNTTGTCYNVTELTGNLTTLYDAPVINSTLTASGNVGSAFTYTITATNTPTSFSATGLPAGLSINTTTGVISGTPATAATTNVTIGATNNGGSDSKTLVITITTGPCLTDNFNTNYGNWTGGSGTYNNSSAGFTGNGVGFNDINDDIITTSTLTNPNSITFNARASSGTSNFTMNIQYSTSASGPWTTATTITANGSNTGTITETNQFFNLSLNLTGTYYLRILQSPRSGGSFYLDDVKVYCQAAIPSYTSEKSGDWSSTSTWVGGVVPTSADNAIIADTHIVVMDNATYATRDAGTTTTVNAGGTLATTQTYINNGTTTINGSFQLNSGGWVSDVSGTNALVYGSNGTLIFNNTYTANSGNYWPTTNGPFNVIINSSSPLTLGFNRTVAGTLTLNAQMDATSTITINGTLQINAGGYISTNAPIYGAASLLKYNSSGTFGRALEWSANGAGTIGTTPGYPNNVQLSNNTTLNYRNGGANSKATEGNLTIDSGSALYMNYGGTPTGGALIVKANIVNAGTFGLGDGAGDDLKVGGDYTNTGIFDGKNRAIFFTKNGIQTVSSTSALTFPYVVFEPTTGNTTVKLLSDLTISAASSGNAISFSGASDVFDLNDKTLTIGSTGVANVINGAGTLKGSNSLSTTSDLILLGTGTIGTLNFTANFRNIRNLTLDRSTNAIGFDLGTDVSVNGTLTLTKGIANLTSNTLTIGNSASISGASSSNYIIADFTDGGRLRKNFANGTGVATSFTFPIGDRVASANSNQYSPATVDFTTANFSSGYISLNVEDSKDINNEATTDYITRYWNLTGNGITSTNYSFTGTYLPVDVIGTEANSKSGRYRISNDTWIEGANLTTGGNTISLTDLTTGSGPISTGNSYNFTAGNPFKRAEINIKQGTTSILTNGTYDFGSQSIGIPKDIVFIVENLGFETLNLSPAATIMGTAYTLSTSYASTVSGGNTTTFTIRFLPTTAGTITGSISIPNNDATGSENPYIINFTGVGQCLLYNFEDATKASYSADEVEINGTNWLLSEALIGDLPNDYKINSKSVRMRAASNAVIEMLEDQTGGISEIIFNYKIYGSDAITAAFVVEYSRDLGNSWYQVGSSFVPTSTVQTFNAALHQGGAVRIRIRYLSGPTNDVHRFNIDNIQLCGYNTLQEIEVFGNATTIQNGSTITKLDNNTLFSNNYFTADGTLTKTFTVTNRGTGTLTLSNPTFTGDSEFSLGSGLTSTSLTTNQSAIFTVDFIGTTNAGLKTATISIVNNDSDENPFTFNVSTIVKNYVRCSLGAPITIAQQDFEVSPATPTLSFVAADGTYASTGGTAYGDNRITTSNMFIGAQSYQVTGSSANSITFETIDVSEYENISFSFKLGAYATTDTQGMETNDKVKVSVSTDGGTIWSEQIQIKGNSNSVFDINTATGPQLTRDYDESTAAANYGCSSNSTNTFSNFIKVTNLPNSTQLKLKIDFNFNTGASEEIWAIDEVKLEGQSPSIKTWNAGWTPAGAPTSTDRIIIDGDYNTLTDGDLSGCECKINSGKLTIGAVSFAEIQSDFNNQGTIIVESDGNLLQRNDAALFTGNPVTVKRNSQLKRLDYTYWAAPVSGQNLKAFSPGTLNSRFYTYNESDDKFVSIDPVNNTFADNGKGYAIRAPNNWGTSLSPFEGKFVGSLNNGEKSTLLSFTDGAHGYNLVGNPYASNLNFYDLHTNNIGVIYNTAYFWTNVNTNPAMQGSDYPNGTDIYNNYAVLNGIGGVAATGTSVGGSVTPNEFIKVGQGFIVKAKQAGSLVFKNIIRTSNSTGIFFNKNGTTPDRFWLQLKTPLNVVTTQLIGYKPEATNGFELDYDSPLLVLGSDAFFSVLEGKKLAIQGKATFTNTDVVKLGTNHYADGTYTISLDKKEGIFATDQKIYLKDNLTGIITNLSEGNYTFTAEKGLTESRFEIKYIPETFLDAIDAKKEDLLVYRNANNFVVKSKTKNIDQIELYDTSGRLFYTLQPHSTTVIIPAEQLSNGVYLLKIKQKEVITTKKIMK